jgi:hypothetical protein
MRWPATVVEWFLQREPLAEARARRNESSAWHQTCWRRATACLALADSLHDSSEPSKSLRPEVVGIYRLACAWLLSPVASAPRPIEALLREADQAQLIAAAGGPEVFDGVRALLLRSVFDDAALEDKQLVADAQVLHGFARSLRRRVDPKYAVRAVVLRRLVRLTITAPGVVLLGVAIAASWSAVAGYLPERPNRLGGVIWRASSTYPGCDLPRHLCNGARVDIFFHTLDDDSPWIEFDLDTAKHISEVEVKNIRIAPFQERATPLLVEVSVDHLSWTEVARHDAAFATWTAQFPSHEARYVRLRVPRKTFLHLENVSIR